jgi:hypothetical protein
MLVANDFRKVVVMAVDVVAVGHAMVTRRVSEEAAV